MWYIIGLGNKGDTYVNTRHNVAWILFEEWNLDWKFEKMLPGDFVKNEEFIFIKPYTYMNRSGEIMPFLKKQYPEFAPHHMVVIYDDLDLPFGTVKISFDRGDGGHNGMKSIIEHLGTKSCTRIRIGIAQIREGRTIKPNVLSPFNSDEFDFLRHVIAPRVYAILKSLASEGLEKTMNVFNTK